MAIDPSIRYRLLQGMQPSRLRAAYALGVARARGVAFSTRECARCVAAFVASGAQVYCSRECAQHRP
jgi:hypothetical protein